MKAGPAISTNHASNQQSSESAILPDLPGITLEPAYLSRGPLAAVYKGWDRLNHRDVIVKVQRSADDQVAAERFRREAAVMARLRHPHIVAVHEFHDGDPAALVLEYVSGRTLANLVNTEGRLSQLRAVQIIEEIAAALDSAHAQGIIHRDVKPSNILLPKRGPAKLTDFGVAHIDDEAPLTMMGDILGTIEYASPEQVHGNQVPDSRSDVYSLAAVAYFALAGVPPFQASDSSTQAQLSVMHRQVFSDPLPLRSHRADIALALDQAVLRGLAKSPEARYPSAGQFAATMRVALGSSALGAHAAESAARVMAATSRRSGVLVGAIAALLLLGTILLWKTRQPIPAHGTAPIRIAKIVPIVPPTSLPKTTVVHTISPIKKTVPAVVKLPHKIVAPVKPLPRATRTANVIPLRRAAPIKATHKPHFALASLKHRRHTLLVATLHPTRPKTHFKATPKRAWLYVYANQNIAPLSPTAHMVNIRPVSVTVDGRSMPNLAAGRWASLPPGHHVIAFNTDPRTGFSSRSNVMVNLRPGAHVSRQILLPVVSNAGARLPQPLPPSINLQNQSSAPAATHIGYTVGWYTVSGWIAANAPGQAAKLVRAAPDWVKVDGKPIPELALGKWAELPAGKHTVTFQPVAGIGAGLKSWDIDLAPQAHLDQKVPLPADTMAEAVVPVPSVGWYTVSGWIAANAPGQAAKLVRATPDWIKVDGKPSPELAQGGWAELPAGKHTVIYQPVSGSGAGPKTWDIDLAAQAHLDQKVPLPSLAASEAAVVAPAVGWYTVSGWISVNLPDQAPRLVRATPNWVMVDGNANPALAQGQWAELSAGRHTVTFQPVAGIGAGLKSWDIDLAPQAHLDQKVPLPSVPLPLTPPHLRNP